jgi:hypothetical protein
MPETIDRCAKQNEYCNWDRKRAMRSADYASAGMRTYSQKTNRRLRRGYDVATHFVAVLASRNRTPVLRELEASFHECVQRWKDETGHLSSVTKAISHPSYLRIIGLSRESIGHEIERLLLNGLKTEPDHWFAALTAITGEDPVKPEDDFDKSVEAWLKWGRDNRII